MLRAPSLLAPFIIFSALQFLMLVCLWLFYVSPLSYIMVPIVERVGGEIALHYPMHLILLPRMYYTLYLPLTALVGFTLFAWAVSMIVDQYERRGVKLATRRASTAALVPSIVVVGAIYVVAVTAVQLGLSFLAGFATNVWVGRALSLAGLATQILVQAFLIYSLYFLVTLTSSPLEAVSQSIRLGRRRLVLTAMLVLTVVFIHFPVDFLLQRADKVVLKFDPELVTALLTAGIVVEIITNYFLFASTTYVAAGFKKGSAE